MIMSTNSVQKSQTAVTVSLDTLKDGETVHTLFTNDIANGRLGSVSFGSLEQAFGPGSLGIIVVKDLPERFVALRKTLLSYSSYLANLPQEQLGANVNQL
jgi:hypothetical protein